MKVLYLVNQPIQYQAPLLRLIAAEPDIDLDVVFAEPGAVRETFDEGFGRRVSWDVPLTDGYRNRVETDFAAVVQAIAAADVVWMHGWQGARQLRALAAAKRLGVPVLMRGENTLAAMPDGTGVRGWLKRRYLNWIFRRCAGFLCIGSDNRAYYQAHGVPDTKLFSMPYAVDNAFFQARADESAGNRAAFRAELGLQDDRPVVLYAGKLQPRKNPLVLIEAFRRLAVDASLLVVGDGEQRAALEDAIQGDERIRFLGFRNQTELPAFYDLADVFVLASHREPWGLAVNEAMNGGCAVVVSDECGSAADLVDDTCGRVVKPGDTTALSDALIDILSDAQACAAMGQAAREKVSAWDFARDVAGLKAALAAL